MFTGKLTVNHSTLVGQLASSGDLQLLTQAQFQNASPR